MATGLTRKTGDFTMILRCPNSGFVGTMGEARIAGFSGWLGVMLSSRRE